MGIFNHSDCGAVKPSHAVNDAHWQQSPTLLKLVKHSVEAPARSSSFNWKLQLTTSYPYSLLPSFALLI